MSKTKDWLMDLEEAQAYGVSIDELPALREELEKMRLEAVEYYRNHPEEVENDYPW